MRVEEGTERGIVNFTSRDPLLAAWIACCDSTREIYRPIRQESIC